MAWLRDFRWIVRSHLTALRERVEDPERMLHQLILDMDEELARVRHHVTEAVADEIQLAERCQRLRGNIRELDERAQSAVRDDNEASARDAINHKLQLQEELDSYEGEYENQRRETAALESSVRDLESKIRQARQRQTLLLARLTRAETATQIRHAVDTTHGHSAFQQFSRFEERVERVEAVDRAERRLAGELNSAQLFVEEERQRQVEGELDTLRERLRQDSP